MPNKLGIPVSNNFVPLNATNKKTNELDISAAVTSSVGTVSAKEITAVFYADSNGNWRLNFSGGISFTADVDLSGNATKYLTFNIGANFKNMTAYQGMQISALSSALVAQPLFSEVGITNNRINFYGGSTTTRYLRFSGDVSLASEPTTYTTAANMVSPVAIDVYIPAASATTTGLISREYTYSGSALTLTYPGGGRNGNSFASASMHILRVGTGYYINILGSMNIAAAGSRTTYIVSNTGFSWPAGTPSMVGILAGGSMQNTSGQGFPVHCYIETSSSLMRATFDWIYPAGSAANETTSVGCSFFIPVV
jgi:hypothetical protein